VTFVRTVLGDIDASELGVTYSHEHLIIDGGRPVEMDPEFDLSDVASMAIEVDDAMSLGLRSVIDAMPCDAGRSAEKLAELATRTGLNIVAPTGLHHERYYGPSHWSHRVTLEELAELFVADIEEGIDANDYAGPVVHRTSHRAGIIKVAGSEGGPSPRDSVTFVAAAEAHHRTGAPILTHCEGGTGAIEQITLLTDLGVKARHITLSHVDKVVDRGYHREIAWTGAFAEYDQAFRWADASNGTGRLLRWMVEDHLSDHVVVGNDAARRRYYTVFGGSPGLGWLLDTLARVHGGPVVPGFHQQIFVDNPARAFAFAEVDR
jgi:predicted metal-dependent phosphotriesterase family hydrolase